MISSTLENLICVYVQLLMNLLMFTLNMLNIRKRVNAIRLCDEINVVRVSECRAKRNCVPADTALRYSHY